MRVLPRLGRVLPLFAVTAPAWAQITIGGPLSDSTTGPLTTGNVYVVVSDISVPSGETLTIQPGVVVKFERDRRFTVDGTLIATSGGPLDIVFTDDRDDTAGGDTNGDGSASSPVPGSWDNVTFTAGSGASTLRNVEVRYAGRALAGIVLDGSTASFRECVVRDSASRGWDLQEISRPTITNCAAIDCGLAAFERVSVEALPGFSGITTTGNGFDAVRVSDCLVSPGSVVDFGPEAGPLGALWFTEGIDIAQGGSLTIRPGAICKFSGAVGVTSDGHLFVDGDPSNRVRFTDVQDDSIGGDTNGDGGASTPFAGAWRGLRLRDTSDGSVVEFADIRYAGNQNAGIELESAAVTIDRCWVRDVGNDGIDCNDNAEVCSVVRCRIDRCEGEAINAVRLERIVDFVLPFGADNDRNWIRISTGTVSGTISLDPIHQFGGSFYFSQNVRILPGAELNVQPGVVIKTARAMRFDVEGKLTIRGSLENPVVMTDVADDSIGGDSNGDGSATTPQPNHWRGPRFMSTTDTSIVVGLEVRYGGRDQPQVLVEQPTVVLREVRSQLSSRDGFRFLAAPIVSERLVADGNVRHGFDVRAGSFDLRQVTAVDNGNTGVRTTAGWTGSVVDSIVRDNGLATFDGVGAGRVRFTNSDGGLAGVDGNIDVDPLFVDAVLGDYHLLDGSPCVDAGDPASPLDADGTRADMGAYFFNTCQPEVFCPQPVVFPPCDPTLQFDGFCSLSSPLPFVLTLPDAPTLSFSIFFYGIGPRTLIAGLPYGDVCVGGPYQRTAPVASGGNPADGPCAGLFEFDFNAYAQSGADPAIVAGSNVIGHFWYRYNAAPNGAVFSSAVEIPVCP